MKTRHLVRTATAAAFCALLAFAAKADQKITQTYDDFSKPGRAGYTITDYASKWFNPYGPGEMAFNDTRSFKGNKFTVSAVPFTVGYDFSVFDHLKYIAVSTNSFPVPARGYLQFSSTIKAETPGAQSGRVIRGTYTVGGAPYAKPTLEGQQAGVVMNMIDFGTGQLFDWFVSGTKVFALVERLPSTVTGNGNVDLDKAYTQIVKEADVGPGPHKVAIRYTRVNNTDSFVEFFLNDKLFARVEKVGIPLDKQGQTYTGIYPSVGSTPGVTAPAPGEVLAGQINSFVIGHGLFSLLDAFPFQHPQRPDLSVSIPVTERLFGQGAKGTFDRFVVETVYFD